EKDFIPIVYVGKATNILVVSPSLPVENVRELIEHARKNSGKLNYATSGIGSISHLTSEMFASMAGVKLTHVPYKGTQLSMPDLAQGNVAFIFESITTAKTHMDDGRVKGLGLFSAKRSEIVPDIPTIHETALPGFARCTSLG